MDGNRDTWCREESTCRRERIQHARGVDPPLGAWCATTVTARRVGHRGRRAQGGLAAPRGHSRGERLFTASPPEEAGAGSTATGCTLYVRSGPFAENDQELVHSQAGEEPWLAGYGNLRVKSLHAMGDEGTALVHWPAGERFISHQHWGGEEILVLSGTFRDEHGTYPKGTWIQSPHLSTHHPFVEEETVIFVKTGHLPRG